MCVTTDLAEKHLKNNYSIEVIRADLIKTIAIIKALEEQLRLNRVGKPFNASSKISEIVIYKSEKYKVNSINIWTKLAIIENLKFGDIKKNIPFKELTNSI